MQRASTSWRGPRILVTIVLGGLGLGLAAGFLFNQFAYPRRDIGDGSIDPTYAAHISTARAGPTATPALPLTLAGHGDHTVRDLAIPPGDYRVTATHNGTGRFTVAVTVTTSPGRADQTVIDATGAWDATTPLTVTGRVTAVTIGSDGDWTIRLE